MKEGRETEVREQVASVIGSSGRAINSTKWLTKAGAGIAFTSVTVGYVLCYMYLSPKSLNASS